MGKGRGATDGIIGGGRARPVCVGVTSIIGGTLKAENDDDVPNRASRTAS